MDENKIPVIVGVGQINDRDESLNSVELMAAALRNADADGGGGWLARIEAFDVVAQLSFPEFSDASAPLAQLLDIAPRHCAQTRYPMGDSPVALLNAAANRVASGEADVCAVAGGEALRTAAKRAAGGPRDAVRDAAARAARPGRERYGIVAPTDIYPFYENACRAAWGQTLAQAQQESAEIWSRFSQVAADNPSAWLRAPLTPEQILEVSPSNRPIAFPYTKLMVANSSVNQGAAFIVTGLAMAKAAGVAEQRLVYVGRGAVAREPGDVLARDRIDRSLSLEASLHNAFAFNGLASADLDCVELYSCFPIMPKLARRVLDWPVERPMSVFGGLTFGGGPIGNYMSHAIAAMTNALRKSGRHGLLFGNGGFATTSHAIVLSRDPALAAQGAHDPSVQAEADAGREPAPVLLDTYSGPGRIETYTVFYDRNGAPRHGVIVARTLGGERFLAYVPGEDGETIGFLTDGAREPVGASGVADTTADGLVGWHM
ncbi:MAG: acetyl-CoA acetyltransferase [Caulobacteraceae bacterium]